MNQENKKTRKQEIKSLSELETFARELASDFKPGDVYGLSGELGAGKTTLVQAIGRVLGITVPMTSPTFVFRKEYILGDRVEGRGEREGVPAGQIKKLVHIDAYRIEGGTAEDLGVLNESDAVTLIEWPEKIERLLPPGTHRLKIDFGEGEERVINLK